MVRPTLASTPSCKRKTSFGDIVIRRGDLREKGLTTSCSARSQESMTEPRVRPTITYSVTPEVIPSMVASEMPPWNDYCS
jgi:hypothetical protein